MVGPESEANHAADERGVQRRPGRGRARRLVPRRADRPRIDGLGREEPARRGDGRRQTSRSTSRRRSTRRAVARALARSPRRRRRSPRAPARRRRLLARVAAAARRIGDARPTPRSGSRPPRPSGRVTSPTPPRGRGFLRRLASEYAPGPGDTAMPPATAAATATAATMPAQPTAPMGSRAADQADSRGGAAPAPRRRQVPAAEVSCSAFEDRPDALFRARLVVTYGLVVALFITMILRRTPVRRRLGVARSVANSSRLRGRGRLGQYIFACVASSVTRAGRRYARR